MKLLSAVSAVLYAGSLAVIACTADDGAERDAGTRANSPAAQSFIKSAPADTCACAHGCCDVEARIGALKERLADEERWFAFIHYQMLYPHFKSMPWSAVYPKQATELQVDTEWLRNVDLKALESFKGTESERLKMMDAIETQLDKIIEMRRAFVRDVYLKVYKIPAEDPAYKVL